MRLIKVISFIVAASVGAATSVSAQDASDLPRIVRSPILVIKSEVLYTESDFGQRVEAERRAAIDDVRRENRVIAAELEAEELALTEQRDSMTSEEFRAAADAFDEKAQRIRAERIEKDRQIAQRAASERQRFLRELKPVLDQILNESNALIILESGVAFAVRDVLDITDRALFQANRLLGDGTGNPQQ